MLDALAFTIAAAAVQDSMTVRPIAADQQHAATVRLTTTNMFRLADKAVARGDLVMAARIYTALEQNRDPDVRAEARFRHARQLLEQKHHRAAAVLLRRILDEKPNVPGVRLELARVLQHLGDSDSALRELRAAQASGLPTAVARLMDRYSEGLRASRAVGANLEIALAPDSNINRATRSDTLGTVLGDFEIDADSNAKSGTGVSLRGHAYRRFPLGNAGSILARLSSSADVYAKSRFNNIAADVAMGPELRFGRNRVHVEIGATQRWFGQKPYLRSARGGVTWVRPMGSRTHLRINGTAALVDNQLNNLQDGKAFSGHLGIETAVSGVSGVGLNFGVDRQSLKDAGYSSTGWRAGIVGWHDWGRTTITAGAEVGPLEADKRLSLFPEQRSDLYSRITLGGTLRQFTFEGFAPVARLTIERNRSSIEVFDYRRTRSELGVVRAF